MSAVTTPKLAKSFVRMRKSVKSFTAFMPSLRR